MSKHTQKSRGRTRLIWATGALAVGGVVVGGSQALAHGPDSESHTQSVAKAKAEASKHAHEAKKCAQLDADTVKAIQAALATKGKASSGVSFDAKGNLILPQSAVTSTTCPTTSKASAPKVAPTTSVPTQVTPIVPVTPQTPTTPTTSKPTQPSSPPPVVTTATPSVTSAAS